MAQSHIAIPTQLSALFSATERLAHARSLSDVVEIVRTAARGITGAQGITFVTCEGDDCHYIAEDAIGPLWEGQRFRQEACVSGWVMHHDEPAVIPDIYTDDRVPHDSYRPTFVKSMAMMPVRCGPKRAAIGAYWSQVGGPDGQALELLELLAKHVGAAIGNVELQRSLTIINEVGAAVASGRDLEETVQKITDAGVELTGAEFGAFFYNLIDDRGESYTLYALSGAPRQAFSQFPMPRNTAVFAPTFEGRGVVRSDNIKLDKRYGHNAPRRGMPEGHLPVSSYLAVSVVSRNGDVHGGLFFGHHREAQFTEQHEKVIEGVAAHAAIAIDNARLSSEQRNAKAALEELNASLERRVDERAFEIRDAVAQLAETERRFHSLVQGVTDYAIYGLDASGQITDWNAGAERIKGYTREEIIGRSLESFYTPEDQQAGMPARTLEIATRTGKFEAEGWRVRKDGSRFWASVVVDALYDDDGNLVGFAKITRDLTEKRAVEEQLRQSQKMEAVGQLTGGIAHDFNNLLGGICGSLEIIERRVSEGRGEGLERFITAAQASAKRAAALTQRLLAFSRQQTLDPKPADANRLVLGMEDLISRTVGPAIRVEVVGAAGLWPVKVDTAQLESALLNLAINARDAMPQGGQLTIETANKWLDDRAARERDLPPGQYISICVTDTGTGIAKDIADRIFDPFFTTKPIGQGTGLGLSMIHGFVRQSGGQVRVYSEPDHGTTMCLYLPRYTGCLTGDATEVASQIPETGAGETVVVIDDEPTIRMLIVEVLEEAGYVTLEASDGPSGLKILQSDARVDLLITDVGLPGGMNGRQVADAARVTRPDLKVLFVTGFAENAAVGNGHLDANMEVVTKPFVMTELANKIADMIGH